MLTTITLIVALCAHPNFSDVQARLKQLRAANPGQEVTLKLDKKAQCEGDQILRGKDAKLFQQLEGKN